MESHAAGWQSEIAALEEDLQFTLLNRTTRRVSLTEAGAAYYDSCRQIIVEMEEAEALGRNGAMRPTGPLHVGIHPVFQISLCRRLGEFLAANPGVKIDLAHTNSPAALLEEGLDVMLRVGSIADSSFVARSAPSTMSGSRCKDVGSSVVLHNFLDRFGG